ncbi:MAG: NAD-dependent epimerase/dehydratase family protein [Candidatus Pacebacteria bacterium]|nr:NAD-dependent epimerase/dehydratase family protein [Candidatus Paceibacterota bacterium]
MKYLLTGGAGFIGSNLVEYLLEKESDVLVIDNLTTGNKENLKGFEDKIEFIQASSGECLNIPQIKDIDGIFHLGMPSSSPLYHNDHNIFGQAINDFIAILDLAKRENCKVVFASTSSIYNGNPLPWKEDMPVFVKDFYSEARYFMERLAFMYNNHWEVDFVGLRLASVFGPKERNKKRLANMVSQILWWILDDKSPILYGDGTQTRDSIYVKDVVRAFLIAMESNVEADIFNVGCGENKTLNEITQIICQILGKNIKPEYQKVPIKNYIANQLADTTKAKNILGFIAQYSLDQGIKELIAYEKQK